MLAPFRFFRIVSIVSIFIILCLIFQSKYLPSTVFYNVSHQRTAKVAKVTVATNTLNSSTITRALRTHAVHNQLHNYEHHVVTEEIVNEQGKAVDYPSGAWSKPAYLLSLLVAELAKPHAERLEWLFWFDADTILLNPQLPLEIFLPPDVPELNDIHILFGANWDGINSGVFPVRVHPWSLDLLSAVVAYPIYFSKNVSINPFRDQSAFQWLLQSPESPFETSNKQQCEHWAQVPMRWFNSLPINNAFDADGKWIFDSEMTPEKFDNGTTDVYDDGSEEMELVDNRVRRKVNEWKAMRGDLVVHFAGSSSVRESWMGPWLDRAEAFLPGWSDPRAAIQLRNETRVFWQEKVEKIKQTRLVEQIVQDWRDREVEKGTNMDLVEKSALKAVEKVTHDGHDTIVNARLML